MKWFKKISIRQKIILIAMTCSLFAVIITSAFNIWHSQEIILKNAEERLSLTSQLTTKKITALLLENNRASARKTLHSISSNKSILIGCLYTANNTLFAQFNKSNESNLQCPSTPYPAGLIKTKSLLLLSQTILSQNTPIGTLQIGTDINELKSDLYLNLTMTIMVSTLSLVLAYLFASQLQSSITTPFKQLQKTALKISLDNNYSHRAEKVTNDELGNLADSFNTMLNKIEKDNTDLHTSELRFKTLTAATTVGIFQTDTEGNHIYVNDQWREITGVFSSNITFNVWVKALHPEERFTVLSRWKESLKTDQEFKMEYRLLKDNGQTRSILCHAKPLTINGKTTGFLGSISDMTELKAVQSQLKKMALYDPLTKLPNRHLFRNNLEKSIKQSNRSGKKLALLFLDIDHFKRINDTMGHDQGDDLLRAIAHRLRFCTRPTDTVARLGGDEFSILIPEISHIQEAETVANKILETLKTPIRLTTQEIIISTSIGITIGPNENEDANTLMKNADLAMYRAKAAGRDNYQFFSAEMNTLIQQHLKIENELRLALQNSEFELFFQPKVKLSNEKIYGYEALLRWNHPTRGLVGPNDFISIAEDTGQIIAIGEWVIKNACENIKQFISCGLLPKDGHIAVNLSARQFHEPNLVNHIKDMIRQHDINPGNLELELTESLIMEDVESAITTLTQLRELGTDLAIDDFGTGYSSLSYLKRLPIQILKVDRSFIKDIPNDKDDMEITAAVIAMAHKLRLKVVAEGVEDKAQLDFLNQNKCDYVQGYLFGKPLPISALRDIQKQA